MDEKSKLGIFHSVESEITSKKVNFGRKKIFGSVKFKGGKKILDSTYVVCTSSMIIKIMLSVSNEFVSSL